MENSSKIIVDACCKIPNAHLSGRQGKGKSACGVLVIDEQGNEIAKVNQNEFQNINETVEKWDI